MNIQKIKIKEEQELKFKEELEHKIEELKNQIEKIKWEGSTLRLEKTEVRIKDLFGMEWKELDTITLTTAGNSITIPNILPKEHLQIKIHITGVSATDRVEIQFNDDTGNNYDNYSSLNGAGEAHNGIDGLRINAASTYTGAKSACIDIWNRKSYDKMVNGIFYSVSNAICLHGGRWINTSSQINKIKVHLNSGSNMSVGSKVTVWGKD